MPEVTADANRLATEAEKALREGAYVALGLGLIWFQRAQVRRRQLAKSARSSEAGRLLGRQIVDRRSELARLARDVDHRVAPVRSDLASRVDQIEQGLPVGPRVALRTARAAAQAPESLLRGLLGLDD